MQTARVINPHLAHRVFVGLEKEYPPTNRRTEPTNKHKILGQGPNQLRSGQGRHTTDGSAARRTSSGEASRLQTGNRQPSKIRKIVT